MRERRIPAAVHCRLLLLAACGGCGSAPTSRPRHERVGRRAQRRRDRRQRQSRAARRGLDSGLCLRRPRRRRRPLRAASRRRSAIVAPTAPSFSSVAAGRHDRPWCSSPTARTTASIDARRPDRRVLTTRSCADLQAGDRVADHRRRAQLRRTARRRAINVDVARSADAHAHGAPRRRRCRARAERNAPRSAARSVAFGLADHAGAEDEAAGAGDLASCRDRPRRRARRDDRDRAVRDARLAVVGRGTRSPPERRRRDSSSSPARSSPAAHLAQSRPSSICSAPTRSARPLSSAMRSTGCASPTLRTSLRHREAHPPVVGAGHHRRRRRRRPSSPSAAPRASPAWYRGHRAGRHVSSCIGSRCTAQGAERAQRTIGSVRHLRCRSRDGLPQFGRLPSKRESSRSSDSRRRGRSPAAWPCRRPPPGRSCSWRGRAGRAAAGVGTKRTAIASGVFGLVASARRTW